MDSRWLISLSGSSPVVHSNVVITSSLLYVFLPSQTWWFSGNTAAPQMSLYSSSMLSVSLLSRLKSTLCSLPLKFNPFCFSVQIRHFSLPQALRPAGSADSTREKASFTDSRLRQPRKTQKKSRRKFANKIVLYSESEHFYWNNQRMWLHVFSRYSRTHGYLQAMACYSLWLAKLGYIFTNLAKVALPTHRAPSTVSPKCTAAPEKRTQVVLEVFRTTKVNITNHFFFQSHLNLNVHVYVYIKAISFLAKFLQNIYSKAKRSLENRGLIY